MSFDERARCQVASCFAAIQSNITGKEREVMKSQLQRRHNHQLRGHSLESCEECAQDEGTV